MELVKNEESNVATAKHEGIDYPDFGSKFVNVISQQSKFSDNVFTVNGARLMDNHRLSKSPIYPIADYTKLMDEDKPYNITKYQPAPGKMILLGITKISPLVLASIIKKEDTELAKYSDPYEYYIIGVYNKQFNDKFGMKALFTLKEIGPKEHNGIALANSEDPLSGFNLAKTFSGLKAELMKRKEEASIERVYCRTILLVDEMDIDGYTF